MAAAAVQLHLEAPAVAQQSLLYRLDLQRQVADLFALVETMQALLDALLRSLSIMVADRHEFGL